MVVREVGLDPSYMSLPHEVPAGCGQVLAERCLGCRVDQLACRVQCLVDLFEAELVRRRRPPQHRDEVAELHAHGGQTAYGWRELLCPVRLWCTVEKLADDQQQIGEGLGGGPDAASLARFSNCLDSRHRSEEHTSE